MKFLQLGLSKLKITGFRDREMKHRVGELTAMYNPSSLALDYQTEYRIDDFINSVKQSNHYRKARPGGLTLELIFDGSLPGNSVPVDMQLSALRELVCEVDPGTGEPHFLQVSWGTLRWNGLGYFAGRMTSLAVRYTLFDRDGSPLRAQATLTLSADESLVLQSAQNMLKAPAEIFVPVPDMSTLPLLVSVVSIGALAASVAAGFTDYLAIAYLNNLSSLSDLIAGEPLLFPQSQQES